MIPYGRQHISEQDVQTVVDVLRSDFLTQGPFVPEFERQLCQYTGAEYGVAVSSGTAALHIACLVLGLGRGDRLWTSPVTFVASANCGLYCGAGVDFVDIDPETGNMSVDKLRQKLILAKKKNQLPKIVVAVHLAGLPCDMAGIHALSQEYGFSVIEDGCHAIGGIYRDEMVGCCRYSDVVVFSFHPVKTITTGEGGMAVTNSRELAAKMDLARSHGITRSPDLMRGVPDGSWYYEQIDLGYNYRMTDLQAALGISQLDRLDEFVAQRHGIAERYEKALAGLPVKLPLCKVGGEKKSGVHLYVVRLEPEKITRSHREVFEFLRDKGIGVNLHYIPVHTQPYYQSLGFCHGDFPEAERYYGEAVSLPLFPDLTREMQQKVIDVLAEALG